MIMRALKVQTNLQLEVLVLKDAVFAQHCVDTDVDHQIWVDFSFSIHLQISGNFEEICQF